MAVLRIHTIPNDDEFLRRRCAEVTEFGPALRQIATDMLETLPTLGGIGLAAPQVGHSIRMVLIDVSDSGPDPEDAEEIQPPEAVTPPPPFFLVNAVITSGEGEASLAEGCLSVPGIRVEVPRKAKIMVDAQTLNGRRTQFEADGLLAIVIQHELDHLDGKLIPDYIALGCKSWREGELPDDREILD